MSKCSDEKKAKIKQSMFATKEKRKHQRPMVFELKIDYSHLNKVEKETLKMFFIEAKWLYNDILAKNNPFSYDCKNKKVIVLNKNRQPEERELKYLPAKNRADVITKLKDSIKGLSTLKKTGKRVGRLKFKSEYNSIELSQYGVTHKITGRNRIKINGIKKPLVVRGLDQILHYYELANAKLVKKSSGYYIKLTCYKEITPNNIPPIKTSSIGLDFGIKTTITTSNGDKYDISIGESDRLKRLQKRLSKCEKRSKNRYKVRIKLGKEYEHIANQRKDKANKIVSKLLSENQIVVMQDENIKGWHKGLFGKQVQYSALGTIKSKLELSKQVIVVDRFFPSTKKCYRCGNVVDISLSERTYSCPKCGLIEDRDIKSAKSILYEGLGNFNYIKVSVPMEYRDFKPVEMKPLPAASATASIVNETGSLRIHS
jgi:transposase